jgi:hypothetical protein
MSIARWNKCNGELLSRVESVITTAKWKEALNSFSNANLPSVHAAASVFIQIFCSWNFILRSSPNKYNIDKRWDCVLPKPFERGESIHHPGDGGNATSCWQNITEEKVKFRF